MIFHVLPLLLMLKNLGSITLVLMLSDREVAHKRYKSLRTPANHDLYISAQNCAKSILQLTKNSFINNKCQQLASSNSSTDFRHLAKKISNNFTTSSLPPLLNLDGRTAVTSICKAEPFAQAFSKNSTLDDSGHILPTHSSSNSTMPVPSLELK